MSCNEDRMRGIRKDDLRVSKLNAPGAGILWRERATHDASIQPLTVN